LGICRTVLCVTQRDLTTDEIREMQDVLVNKLGEIKDMFYGWGSGFKEGERDLSFLDRTG